MEDLGLDEVLNNFQKEIDNQKIISKDATPIEEIKKAEIPEELTKEEDALTGDLFSQISAMTIPQKIKLAMFGNVNARRILIRDSNKLVSSAVLSNPRFGESEAVEAAKNSNTSEHILRMITRKSNWMKNYSLKVALMFNPKVPVGVTLPMIKSLTTKDLRALAKSKNIPTVLVTQSKKLIEKREKR